MLDACGYVVDECGCVAVGVVCGGGCGCVLGGCGLWWLAIAICLVGVSVYWVVTVWWVGVAM